MKKLVRLLKSKPFQQGVADGFAVWLAPFAAFSGVTRRVFKGDIPDVLYEAKTIWWTEEEKTQRAKAVFAQIEAEYERDQIEVLQ